MYDTRGGKGIAVAVMLVGIGFLTLVIGAVAQRFIAAEVEEVEEELTEEMESVEQALRELREAMGRLQRLEVVVRRMGPHVTPAGSVKNDPKENTWHKLVCNGTLTLRQAQELAYKRKHG